MPNKLAVSAAFQVYADALNAGDDQGVRDAFIWPLAHMPADGVVMVDKPPALPSEMRAQTDWARSTFGDIEVVAASDTKAHVVLRNFERLRSDGSLIESGSSFYAFCKTDKGWKIFAVSGILFPA